MEMTRRKRATLSAFDSGSLIGKDSIVNRAMRTLSPQAFESPTGKKKDRKPSQRKQGTVRLSKRIEKNTVKKCVCAWLAK